MSMASVQRVSWELAEGDAIAPGRTVLRRLGGGNLYEAYLVWDELLLSICVAKVVRPDQAEDQGAGGPACREDSEGGFDDPTHARSPR